MTNTQIAAGECLAELIKTVDRYCAAHRAMYESPIGEDGVLGHGATLLLQGIDTLLSGERGRQDGGHLSAQLHELAARNELLDDNGEL